ncbi:MAG: UTP--glucose-1-phosphate uridylyltransferase GalU [Candidatus Tectomicrobia bacterium]|uniref:UTP--glucose-1-phosphate uridylyltransferase n=1 Tax=Tectimicrobiota bacterium TaxID=2528274 RepID=A0A932GQ88_UNCTE|nr:UTP--glucose-1-phosphate uridylyltransferase GalU [Candidatus Tectomicrobia bacterium]
MGISKAVLPAAGLGTRFLPATKSCPKEMLPLVDKPLIQYVVEETKASGIREVIIITGRGKNAIEDHFDVSFELEQLLVQRGKNDLVETVRKISNMISFCYVRQREALGLGHAILCARQVVGHEPFAVLLGDDIIHSEVPCLRQLMNVYERHQCSILAVERVPRNQVSNYGVVAPRKMGDRLYQVLDLVEKPDPDRAPSDLAIIGRYILTPEIFREIEDTQPDSKGEIQLTDALRLLLKSQTVYAYEFEGTRYDAGSKLGFLKATVEFALRDPELGESFRSYLEELDLERLQPLG